MTAILRETNFDKERAQSKNRSISKYINVVPTRRNRSKYKEQTTPPPSFLLHKNRKIRGANDPPKTKKKRELMRIFGTSPGGMWSIG